MVSFKIKKLSLDEVKLKKRCVRKEDPLSTGTYIKREKRVKII